MNSQRWRRFGAIAGILFVATVVVASAITGVPPEPEDSDEVFQAFFVDKHDQLLAQAWLIGFSAPLLLWFGAAVRRLLRDDGQDRGFLPDVFLAGATANAGLLIVAMAVQVAIVRSAARIDATTLRAVGLDFGAAVVALLGFILASTAFAFATSVRSSRVLPRWTVVLALVALFVNLAGTVGVFIETGPFSIEGGFTVFVPMLSTVAWYLGTSVAIVRTREPQRLASVPIGATVDPD